jgi:hypothetical protein
MHARTLLRIASGATAFFAFGHTMGMLAEPDGPAEAAVLEGLAAYRFDVMGVQRSHAAFYEGLGWYLTLTLLTLTGVIWQLSQRVEPHPELVRPLLVGPLVFCVASTVFCAVWFFPAPLIASAIAAVALAGAWWGLRVQVGEGAGA